MSVVPPPTSFCSLEGQAVSYQGKRAKINPAAMQVIYLEKDDEFATIRRRLTNAQAGKVLLVIPPGCQGLRNPVHIRLLERLVADLPIRVALVTSDSALKGWTRECDFPVFPSVEKGKGSRWPKRPSRRRLPLRREHRLPIEKQARRGMQRGEVLLLFSLFAGFFMLLLLGFVLLIPGATVTLEPLAYPLEESLTLHADSRLGEIQGLSLSATMKEVEVAGWEQIATTAKKDVPDGYAQGEVIFTNKRSEPTTVVSGTIVSTSAGVVTRFRTLEEIILPPQIGGRARVAVEALDPGPSGNVPAWTIRGVEGPIGLQVNVINDSPTEGGTVKQVSYVTGEDKEQVRAALMQRLKQEAYNTLSSQAQEAYLPPESIHLITLMETYDKFAGEEADALALDMRVLARAMVVDREDIRKVALAALESRLSQGFQLLSPAVELRFGDVVEASQEEITFTVGVKGWMMMEVDEAQIKGDLAGRSVDDAVAYLERRQELADRPQIELTPDWWPRLPWLPFRISLVALPQEE